MSAVFVVPVGEAPSGGHVYDERLAGALASAGRPLRTVAVPGGWPRPDAAARARLDAVLAELPDGSTVLLDGLVACGVPEVVVPHTGRLRTVVLVHLPLADETGLAPDAARDLAEREGRVLRAAARVVATSAAAAADVAARHGVHGVHAVPPGVDPAPPARGTDGASHLLCVASLTPRKGHETLLDALALVRGPAWSCECVGPLGAAGRVAELRARAGSLPVRFVGARTGPDLRAAYDAADLVVLPSRAETYGMVVTEALARAVPVVATSVGGVPEALGRDPHGRRPGLLVPPQDPAALGDALRRWLTDASLRERLRDAARLRRRNLAGWEEAARAMAAVLNREVAR
ncbi:glycosyltransferase involved in cell wall biosynthesis [Nocardiopsis sp. Huas11]|uniref:glycosyltransferase family 4 protein n=1 Tax=Nocardiopsis sp. Huas11 TaxID=2183912 RepID=UPI000EAEAB1B|nr:glycosyltransferase family 4 protein [Nocardiopsis sp. Huas11]RKS09064.1 glycosyltransferase involved in cell wall biosynthesis [Nocardiopsis sp. Huas11]